MPIGNLLKDLSKFRIVGARKIESLKAEPEVRSGSTLFQDAVRVEPVNIIELALQRITEDVISLRNPLETLLCMMITRVDVRMKPAGQLPKSSFNVVVRGGSVHLENDIKIFSASHSRQYLLLLVLLVGIDVLGVDDVICLAARTCAGAVTVGTGLATLTSALSWLCSGLVHRLRQLV